MSFVAPTETPAQATPETPEENTSASSFAPIETPAQNDAELEPEICYFGLCYRVSLNPGNME